MTGKTKQNKKSNQREIIEWGLLLGFILLIYTTGFHHTLRAWILSSGIMNPSTGNAIEEQLDADYNFKLASNKGEIINLADYKGKVVFINFWATWCPPCIAEMPNIHRLYQKIASEDIIFLMVSMDDDLGRVDAFMERNGYTFPIYYPAQNLPGVYNHNSIPRTYVISPKGKIVSQHVGMANYNNRKFQNFLTGLEKN